VFLFPNILAFYCVFLVLFLFCILVLDLSRVLCVPTLYSICLCYVNVADKTVYLFYVFVYIIAFYHCKEDSTSATAL
jgi:hypothetical protein